jgi:hypothetical protein
MEPNPDSATSGPLHTPHEVPFEQPDLGALGGHIGPEPEDFVVDEVPVKRTTKRQSAVERRRPVPS